MTLAEHLSMHLIRYLQKEYDISAMDAELENCHFDVDYDEQVYYIYYKDMMGNVESKRIFGDPLELISNFIEQEKSEQSIPPIP